MQKTAADIRNAYYALIDRLTGVRTRILPVVGNQRPLNFPDWHLLSEGMLLTAWTHWEELNRQLFIHDLATDAGGMLRKDVKATGFRYKHSDARVAELVVDHPDPSRFIDWNRHEDVKKRADALLSPNHRFTLLVAPRTTTLADIKKVRNAIAHNSDSAWESFMKMVRNAPYSLTAGQRKGLTVGRFLTSHTINGVSILEHYLQNLRDAAHDLVP